VITVRPHRIAVQRAVEWAQKQIKMHDPKYGVHLATLRDEVQWLQARRESVLTALREVRTGGVIPVKPVQDLLTEAER
jgi:hypothetical protein